MSTTPPRAPRRPRTVQRADGPFEDPYAWLRDREDPAVVEHLERFGISVKQTERFYAEIKREEAAS